MTFLLISGRTNTGKTNVCNALHNMIATDPSFKVRNNQVLHSPDLLAHYEKGGKHIVLNSRSDEDYSMLDFCQYLDSLTKKKVRPDIIITTIRETNVQRNQMSHMLALLDAIGKGTKKLENYFNQNIAKKSSFAPTTLSHHAFTLHLKKQALKGSQAPHNKILKQYWVNSASITEQMLNFAIANL